MGGAQGVQPKKAKQETDEERRLRLLKEQVVRELGLWDRLLAEGWGGLSAKESGRVGGIVARRLREGGDAAVPGVKSVHAILRTKPDCSLCDKAEAALERIARDVALTVQRVEVDASDPDANRVPIVEIEGVEVQTGRVSEFRLRNWLKERGFLDATR